MDVDRRKELLAIYVAECWLAGCCGSPLLPVYLSLLGAKAMAITKPVVLGLTLASVGAGWVLSRRNAKTACCAVADASRGSGGTDATAR